MGMQGESDYGYHFVWVLFYGIDDLVLLLSMDCSAR